MKLEYLIELYLNATATPAQERELRQRLLQGEALPSELEPLRPLVCADLNTLLPSLQPDAILSTPDEAATFDAVVKKRRRKYWLVTWSLPISVAAVVAVVLVLFHGNEVGEPNQPTSVLIAQSAPATPHSTIEAQPQSAQSSCSTAQASVVGSRQSQRLMSSNGRVEKLASRRSQAEETEASWATTNESKAAPMVAQAAGQEVAAKPLNEEAEPSEHIETRINRHRHIAPINHDGLVAMQ